MQQQNCKIILNEPLTSTTWKMMLECPTEAISAPGQFINIALPNKFLRRPISICDWDDNTITIIYKIVGEGTRMMSQMTVGSTIDALVGLGNGFSSMPNNRFHPVLLGGGVGVPPLFALAKKLKHEGLNPVMIMGFNTRDEIFYFDEFKALGIDVFVSTVDGTAGTKGFVVDAIDATDTLFDYFYACGPLPMLRTLVHAVRVEGQLSMEERMGCGFGACMGCSIQTKSGNKRVCKEGPVFLKSDLIL